MEDIYESLYQDFGFLQESLDEEIYGEGAKIVEILIKIWFSISL